MRTVSARQANHQFSNLLARVQRGEEVLITKRGNPVAVLRRYHPALMTKERKKAIQHAISAMAKGLSWAHTMQSLTRDAMHERW